MPSVAPPLAWLVFDLIAAYAFGGLSPGWLLVRHAGNGDLRDHGSGTTGATNAGRILGDRGFLIVMLLDAIKGAIAVLAIRWLAPETPWWALVFPAVIAGHIWPVWLGFRGGRGAATFMGGCFALSPLLGLVSVALGLAAIALTGKRFVGGAVAFAASLGLMWWLLPGRSQETAYLLAAGLVLLAHRGYLPKYFAP